MAKLIDGKAISAQIKDEVREKVSQMAAQGVSVSLAVIQVGNKNLEGEDLDGAFLASGVADVPGGQMPIIGVNAPSWGIPASQSPINMTELPTVPAPEPEPFIQPMRPIPSTSAPEVESNWTNH